MVTDAQPCWLKHHHASSTTCPTCHHEIWKYDRFDSKVLARALRNVLVPVLAGKSGAGPEQWMCCKQCFGEIAAICGQDLLKMPVRWDLGRPPARCFVVDDLLRKAEPSETFSNREIGLQSYFWQPKKGRSLRESWLAGAAKAGCAEAVIWSLSCCLQRFCMV